MSSLDISVNKYFGFDIVQQIINLCENRYRENKKYQFNQADISKHTLPHVDMILCRDCLFHFSHDDIFKTLSNFKKTNSHYLLTTTFTYTKKNEDITTGDWQPLNLELPPFNFPPPQDLLIEGCLQNGKMYEDKSLGLWDLKKIIIPKK